MARNAETPQGKDNKTSTQQSTQQSPGRSGMSDQQQAGASTAQTGGGTMQSGSGRQSDQERAIQTTRDTDRSSSVSRGTPSAITRGFATSPFWLMRRVAQDMENMLQSIGGPSFRPLAGRSLFGTSMEPGFWAPQVETFRRGDEVVVRADLPGLKKEDIKVEVDNGVLTISGQRAEEREEDEDGYYRSERSYGQFFRAVPLPDEVTGDKIDATFKDGVLEVRLAAPKMQERKAKQIDIH